MAKYTVTHEDMVELTETLLKVQHLPTAKRLAIQYYLKGMLDTSLLSEEIAVSELAT